MNVQDGDPREGLADQRLTRRQVLKGALVAGAGVALGPTLAACGGGAHEREHLAERQREWRAEEGRPPARRDGRGLGQGYGRRPGGRRDRAVDRLGLPDVRLAAAVGP